MHAHLLHPVRARDLVNQLAKTTVHRDRLILASNAQWLSLTSQGQIISTDTLLLTDRHITTV